MPSNHKDLLRHLQGCKLNEERYKKLCKILEKIRMKAKNETELTVSFADKCYGKEPDRELAKEQAEQFLTALFGSVGDVFKLGAEAAVDKIIKKLYEMIKPIEIRSGKSEKFNALDHGKQLEKEENIEESPIWKFQLGRFLVGPTLGVGGTATVKLAYDKDTKDQVALKILQSKYAYSAKEEINILKQLNHDNIIRIYECFDNVYWNKSKTTVFAIEYANGGELIEYLMYTEKFEPPLARWFFQNLVAGVKYCHEKDIVHRDLKHDNCLLGNDFQLKITDFGFARKYFKDGKEQMKTAIGTAQYAAPEILNQEKYNEKVDIFSMGVMLFIALAGSQPWRKADPKTDRWYNWVYNKKWETFWNYHADRSHKFSDNAKELLQGMLCHKPAKRWSIKDIEGCMWFNDKALKNEEAEKVLKKRKLKMDKKKFDAATREVKSRKAIPLPADEEKLSIDDDNNAKKDMMPPDEDTKNLMLKSNPPPYDLFRIPLTAFKTKENAFVVLDQIVDRIAVMKGDTEKDKLKPYELKFEVKLVTQFKLKDEDKTGASYLVKGQVNVYSDTGDSGNKIVVFTNTGDWTSRMYLPKVFGDVMTELASIRCDVEKEDDDVKED